jgi:Ca2+/Na+ antiporter
MQDMSAVGENIILFLVILGIVAIILTRKKDK